MNHTMQKRTAIGEQVRYQRDNREGTIVGERRGFYVVCPFDANGRDELWVKDMCEMVYNGWTVEEILAHAG